MIIKIDIPSFFINTKPEIFLDFHNKSNYEISYFFDKDLDFIKFSNNFIDNRIDLIIELVFFLYYFYQSNFQINDLINFLFRYQNFIKKEYKFFLNHGFNNIFFDSSSSCFDVFKIKSIKNNFHFLSSELIKLFKKIISFFKKYHKQVNIKNNFIFFFILNINILNEFLIKIFNNNFLKEFNLQSKNLFGIIKQNFNISDISFDFYFFIMKNEISKYKFISFEKNFFDIINYKNNIFLFSNFLSYYEINFSNKNIVFIKDINIDEILIKDKKLNEIDLIILNFSDKINDIDVNSFFYNSNFEIEFRDFILKNINSYEDFIEFNYTKKEDIIKINFFDLYNYIFKKNIFIIEKYLKIRKSYKINIKKNQFNIYDIFDNIISKFFENFNNFNKNEYCILLKNYIKDEIDNRIEERYKKFLFELIDDAILYNFLDLFININAIKILNYGYFEYKKGDFFLLSKYILYNFDENNFNFIKFIYDEDFSLKDMLNFKKRFDIFFDFFIIYKLNKSKKLNIKIYNYSYVRKFSIIQFNSDEIKDELMKLDKIIEEIL